MLHSRVAAISVKGEQYSGTLINGVCGSLNQEGVVACVLVHGDTRAMVSVAGNNVMTLRFFPKAAAAAISRPYSSYGRDFRATAHAVFGTVMQHAHREPSPLIRPPRVDPRKVRSKWQ